MTHSTQEHKRLQENYSRENYWLQWGPYLSERQWGTVREDYSHDGSAWSFFPHDHARSRAYRWGEDGLAGISDSNQHLCFAIALWNGKDPILKERMFGLAGPEGNHGEDCKELYYYLDATPTHSYLKHLYKYPHAAFPYDELVRVNRERSITAQEYELLDTGVLSENRYFDVVTEYAKASPTDILIRITVNNRGPEAAPIWILPTLWFRNEWSFGVAEERPKIEPSTSSKGVQAVRAIHHKLGEYWLSFKPGDQLLFTENETHSSKLFGHANANEPYVKDAFHRVVVGGERDLLSARTSGTKAAPVYYRQVPANGSIELRLRLSQHAPTAAGLEAEFSKVFDLRLTEADAFYAAIQPTNATEDHRNIQRQAFAGMIWSKQFYHIDIPRWLKGDPNGPTPPDARKRGRNSSWQTLNNEDIISMPDKWEYPWYAAWDLAFHCVPLAMVDPDFAKEQLILFLREWYMHPNGQLPAYEWAFGDVNPPVHAWACLQVFRMDAKNTGLRDVDFLKRVFHKLLINFTWWVNRKDAKGNNVFEGGFLGLDNIGVFDRSNAIPGGGILEQADGTAWMAMYCLNMLEMAIEISMSDRSYEDVTTKFFEHFVYIAQSLNQMHSEWTGAWDDQEGFFFDILELPGYRYIPLKVKSLVGLSTLFAVLKLDSTALDSLTDFKRRLNWFRDYHKGEEAFVIDEIKDSRSLLLSLIPIERLQRLITLMMDENEFLSPGGIRSLSKVHEQRYAIHIEGQEFGLEYTPGESTTSLFGGNSNWRGPVWMPMNFLLVKALREYHSYYGDALKIEMPRGSGAWLNLGQVADELTRRLVSIFEADQEGHRPVHADHSVYATDPHFRNLILFYEYFHGDTSRGVGATHQTGWTGLVAELIDELYTNQKSHARV